MVGTNARTTLKKEPPQVLPACAKAVNDAVREYQKARATFVAFVRTVAEKNEKPALDALAENDALSLLTDPLIQGS